MRLAVISDIHSNLEALQAALKAIDKVGVDAIYCLGDIVGYNANPSACIDLVQEWCDGVVLGNHDIAVARNQGTGALPADARKAVRYNRDQLSPDQMEYLATLPLKLTAHGCTFVHATPDEPRAWKRISTYPEAQAQFKHFDTDVCFIGHTHVPAVMSDQLGILQVRPGHRYLINTGSVGQPRDQNPKLGFVLFDTEAFDHECVRLSYDVEAAAAKVRRAALPSRLAERLLGGW